MTEAGRDHVFVMSNEVLSVRKLCTDKICVCCRKQDTDVSLAENKIECLANFEFQHELQLLLYEELVWFLSLAEGEEDQFNTLIRFQPSLCPSC